MANLLKISILAAILGVGVQGAIVYHAFEINYGSGTPDGVSKNAILKINGQFPGPTIEAFVGDTIQIDVTNRIQDRQNTSLHWHGIHQRGSIFEDGPSMITQCPLAFGHTQRYEFTVEQWGTYWYHGHVKSQYSEGLWGPLIIHNRVENYRDQYDAEFTMSLSDWYHPTARVNEEWYLSPASDMAGPPLPDSLLINGFGRYPCDIAWSKNVVCLPHVQRRPVFNLPKGKTYRLRLINSSSRVTFNFSIDSHSLEAIEVDGQDIITPVVADLAQIAPGQRYSFLIRTRTDLISPSDEFLIRAVAIQESLDPNNDLNINRFRNSLFREVTAVMRYAPPTFSSITRVRVETQAHSFRAFVPARVPHAGEKMLDEFQLLPWDGSLAPSDSEVGHRFSVNAGFTQDDMLVTHASFNMTPFELPDDKPILYKVLDRDFLPQGFPFLRVEYMSVVELVINNFLGAHPFHMHGHQFWIVGKGRMRLQSSNDGNVFIPYDESIDGRQGQLVRNAPIRDTVFLQRGEWVVIRFIADNPGVWTVHCHIDFHNLGGMAFVFLEGEEEMRRRYSGELTQHRRRLCRY